MVFLNKILNEQHVIRKHMRGFMDSLRLHLKGGTGGNGLPKYGGVGGQGGSIFVVAKGSESLIDVKHKWPTKRIAAGHGGNSSKNKILGEPGESINIEVPLGVTVYSNVGTKIADINEEGTNVLIAKGGVGGSYTTNFFGKKGQTRTITLDLKLIADVGLVGFPNAGKSTLLKMLSKAKPKIASYPFTTIKPNIGVMEFKDLRSISIADLPGLIEGAHVNIGMGHKFLKHVERTKMLLLIADINGFQLSPQHTHRSCLETIILLNKELELYNKDLLNKPAMLLINKMDIEGSDRIYQEIKDKVTHLSDCLQDFPEEMRPENAIKFDEVLSISAKYQDKKDLVRQRIRDILDLNADLNNIEEIDRNYEYIKNVKENMIEKGPNLV